MATKYIVTLTSDERTTLDRLLTAGKAPARKLTRARILLKLDAGEHGPAWTDEEVIDALDTSASTVLRLRRRFIEQGFEAALDDTPSERVYERRLDGAAEARLVALACSTPPEGRATWTLQLLADRLVELHVVDTISDETVRRALKKTSSSRG
jgi:homeodomain-containing protein